MQRGSHSGARKLARRAETVAVIVVRAVADVAGVGAVGAVVDVVDVGALVETVRGTIMTRRAEMSRLERRGKGPWNRMGDLTWVSGVTGHHLLFRVRRRSRGMVVKLPLHSKEHDDLGVECWHKISS